MSEPITTAELRTHLRLTSTTEDTYLGSLIAAARELIEHHTERALVPRTVTLRLDDFPQRREFIELPMAPVVSITSITYLDGAGAAQTFAGANYSLLAAAEPPRVVLDPDLDWPDTLETEGAVTITYAAGYATPGSVPGRLKMACLWLAAWWYGQRVPVAVGGSINELPHHLEAVVSSQRVYLVHGDDIRAVSSVVN